MLYSAKAGANARAPEVKGEAQGHVEQGEEGPSSSLALHRVWLPVNILHFLRHSPVKPPLYNPTKPHYGPIGALQGSSTFLSQRGLSKVLRTLPGIEETTARTKPKAVQAEGDALGQGLGFKV